MKVFASAIVAMMSTLQLFCSQGDVDLLLVVPTPEWAANADIRQLPDGRRQISFDLPESYLSTRARDFYDKWAEQSGWEKVSPTEESWSSDEWFTYLDQNSTRIDQLTVHWRSPEEEWSLRLALLHRDSHETQEVYVILSPYYLLENLTESGKTYGDFLDEWENRDL